MNTEYTKIPNILIDVLMRDMSEAELRAALVVLRQTVGYQTDEPVPISLTKFAEFTGLTRRAMYTATQKIVNRGVVIAGKNGKQGTKSYGWNLDCGSSFCRSKFHSSVEVSSTVDEKTVEATSTATLYKEKESFKEKKKDSTRAKSGTKKSLPGVVLDFAKKLAEICHEDYSLNSGKYNKATGKLLSAKYTLEDLDSFREFWYSQDWRGKQGQKPNLANVNELIKAAKESKRPTIQGNKPHIPNAIDMAAFQAFQKRQAELKGSAS